MHLKTSLTGNLAEILEKELKNTTTFIIAEKIVYRQRPINSKIQ